jgi:hypothetical protein
VELTCQYRHYGYRRITALLKRDGWQMGKRRRSWVKISEFRRKMPILIAGMASTTYEQQPKGEQIIPRHCLQCGFIWNHDS